MLNCYRFLEDGEYNAALASTSDALNDTNCAREMHTTPLRAGPLRSRLHRKSIEQRLIRAPNILLHRSEGLGYSQFEAQAWEWQSASSSCK